jgi:hypothetical protein
MKEMGRTPTLVLCSRNARPEKGLVRRPHLDQHECPSKRGKVGELGGIIYMDGGRSTRAMGDNSNHLRGALKGKRNNLDESHRIYVHLVNQEHAQAGESPQPTTSLPCGSEQYPIAAMPR